MRATGRPVAVWVRTLLALVAVLALAGTAAVMGTTGPARGAAEPTHPVPWTVGEPTRLVLTADQPVLPVDRTVTLRGRLTDGGGTGAPAAAVQLESMEPRTGAWSSVADLVTDGSGAVSAALAPTRSTVYRLHHGAPGSAEESVSAPVRVRVTELTAGLRERAVRYGRDARVSGVLVASPRAVVRLERRVGGRWTEVDRTRTARDQSYAFTVRPTAPGFSRWRVVREQHRGGQRLVAGLPRLDAFRLHTYSVTTRGAVQADVDAFRATVAATYANPRGWPRAHHRFREVRRGGDFTVVLARAADLPRFAWFCSIRYSCQAGRFVVVNAARWTHGSPYFTGTLATYRRYLVDHETGHWLGLGHAICARRGARAPVMQQQSKGMQGCRPNSWPLPREVRAVS
jgi:hypothetical protein